MKEVKKKLATIQIDVDGLWVIYQHFGQTYRADSDPLYTTAFPRFLDLFDQYNIKATLFVVGHDLRIPARVALLKDALKRGHEIANHTMNHTEGFSFLSREEKIKEIKESETMLLSALGIKPQGFRTPSNDVDEETLHILEDRGYLYDSSLMPTWCGPIIKQLKFSRLGIKRKDHYLGQWHYVCAPLTPYHPSYDALAKRGTMKLVEVPITTMPFVRIPFHTSFVFATAHFGLGSLLFNVGYALLSLTSLPLNFIFHTNELSDAIAHRDIQRQFGLNLPLRQKEKLCGQVLGAITQKFDCVTTETMVKHFFS